MPSGTLGPSSWFQHVHFTSMWFQLGSHFTHELSPQCLVLHALEDNLQHQYPKCDQRRSRKKNNVWWMKEACNATEWKTVDLLYTLHYLPKVSCFHSTCRGKANVIRLHREGLTIEQGKSYPMFWKKTCPNMLKYIPIIISFLFNTWGNSNSHSKSNLPRDNLAS